MSKHTLFAALRSKAEAVRKTRQPVVEEEELGTETKAKRKVKRRKKKESGK